jgi:hypothetical protein
MSTNISTIETLQQAVHQPQTCEVHRRKLCKPVLRARNRLQRPISIKLKGGTVKSASVHKHVVVVLMCLTVRVRPMHTLLSEDDAHITV